MTNFMITSNTSAPIDAGAVTVTSGDTLYWNDQPYVTSTTNQGSLTVGQIQVFSRPMWVRSAGLTAVATATSPAFTSVPDPTRSSNCATMDRRIGTVNAPLSSGFVYGGIAVEQVGSTYTKMRLCTGTSVPAGVTALRMGIADSSGNILQQTADLSVTITAASTFYDNIPLSASQVTVQGGSYYLCVGWAGTTFSVAGIAGRAAAMYGAIGTGPAMQRSVGGYVSGNLPNLATAGGNSATIPWLEMVP